MTSVKINSCEGFVVSLSSSVNNVPLPLNLAFLIKIFEKIAFFGLIVPLNTLSARDKFWNGYGFIKWFFKPKASSPSKTYGSVLSDCGSLEGCGMLRRPYSLA